VRVWLVRAGRGGELERVSLENGISSLDYPEVPDLREYTSRKNLEAAVASIYSEESKRTNAVHVRQLWEFYEGIQLGDIIAMPLSGGQSIRLGTVEGPYEYRSEASNMEHARRVKWVKRVGKEEIDSKVLRVQGTLVEFGDADANRILELLSSDERGTTLQRGWVDDIVDYFKELGGEAHYSELYRQIEDHPRRELGREWQAVVRRTIEEHSSDTTIWSKRRMPDLFRSVEGLGKGVWALRAYETPLINSEVVRGPIASRGGSDPLKLRNIPSTPPQRSQNPDAPIDPEARRQAMERRTVAHYRLVRAFADRAAAHRIHCVCSQYADVLCEGAIFEMKTLDDDEIAQVRAAIGQLYHYLFIHRDLPEFRDAKLYAVFDKPIGTELEAFLKAQARISVIIFDGKIFRSDDATRRRFPWLF
jgi:hypothetical protein